MNKEMPRWNLANRYAVPGTGRGICQRLFRGPRNISVKRAIYAAFDTLKGLKVPPDSYDDIYIAANRDRNWKRHRNTQWKEPRP